MVHGSTPYKTEEFIAEFLNVIVDRKSFEKLEAFTEEKPQVSR
jgi:hypothetical protein